LKIQQLTILCTAILAFQQCRPKPIDIKVKQAPEKIAVSSLAIADNFMVVWLSRSFSALEKDKQLDEQSERLLVKNATVLIRHDNITDTLFPLDAGIYVTGKITLSEYSGYDLYVLDPGTGQQITATTVMQPYCRFDSIKPYKTVSGRDTSCRIYFELSDDLSHENYYVVNYAKQSEASTANNGKSADVNRILSGKMSVVETKFDLLTDASFTNGKYTGDKLLEQTRPSDTVAVSVAAISKGYYEFLTAFKRSGTLLNALTGEPITFPSNVKNGLGYFNAYVPQIKYFYLKEY
jgi:hypothetical protein